MSYNPSIPGANDNLSTSQGQIQNNFTQLNTLFVRDHYAYSDATNGGYHKQVTLQNVAAPAPVAPASAVYSKTVSGVQELFFKNGAAQETQLTSIARPLWKGVASDANVDFTLGVAGVSLASNGYLYLPNGLLIQWGRVTGGLANTGTVTFATANKNFTTACYNVQCTLIPSTPPTSNAQCMSVSSVSTTTFNWNYSGGSAYNGFYWLAIGR